MSTSNLTRADRLRLIRRMEMARRASDLLRSKEEVLERERVRLEGHAGRADERWHHEYEAAAAALLRARMLGVSPELDGLVAAGSSAASVTPDWTMSMGVVYPGDVGCEPGPLPGANSTAAVVPAAESYRSALRAAAVAAAAAEAVRRLDVELAATRRRRRAVEQHLVPSLEADLRRLDLGLDELDREEALRIRTATQRQEASRS